MIDYKKHIENLSSGTEGEWRYSEKENGCEVFDIRRYLIATVETKEDAELICKSHNDLGELLSKAKERDKVVVMLNKIRDLLGPISVGIKGRELIGEEALFRVFQECFGEHFDKINKWVEDFPVELLQDTKRKL